MDNGPTLYKPPSYVRRKLSQFAYTVRDKVNSHHGYDRLELIDWAGLEDGDVLISLLDNDKDEDDVLFIKWNSEKSLADEVVRELIQGDVPDITNEFSEVKENIKWEDR